MCFVQEIGRGPKLGVAWSASFYVVSTSTTLYQSYGISQPSNMLVGLPSFCIRIVVEETLWHTAATFLQVSIIFDTYMHQCTVLATWQPLDNSFVGSYKYKVLPNSVSLIASGKYWPLYNSCPTVLLFKYWPDQVLIKPVNCAWREWSRPLGKQWKAFLLLLEASCNTSNSNTPKFCEAEGGFSQVILRQGLQSLTRPQVMRVASQCFSVSTQL